MNVDKILELIQFAIDRSGMKGIITLGAMYVIWKLGEAGDINGWAAAICITIVALGFFVFRNFETINKGTESCPPLKPTS
jgi:hypothetical protein